MEKTHKTPNSWSELPQDLGISVFERLGFADFKRAKSVCSSWHSASRQSVPKSDVPWLIVFPKDINNTSLTLFNPEEKDKLYKTQAFDVEIANSFATCGSWFLMQDLQWNLYMVNIFTHERINLPHMESQLGVRNVERTEEDRLVTFDNVSSRYRDIFIRSPMFWIDEKTKEYIVLCALGPWCVVYSKNGDNFWNQIPELSDCNCLLYKDHKLYFMSYKSIFRVLDFSGQIPQQTFQCGILLDPYPETNVWQFNSRRIVVTITGDVLMVDMFSGPSYRMEQFRIFKIYSSSGFQKKYEIVDSLGDETMLLDLGITVLANKVEGLHTNSIYFCGGYGLDAEDLLTFNLETEKIEGLHEFGFDFSLYGDARWFVPR